MLKSGKLKLADDMIVTAQEAANKAETVFTIYDDVTNTEIASGQIGGGGGGGDRALQIQYITTNRVNNSKVIYEIPFSYLETNGEEQEPTWYIFPNGNTFVYFESEEISGTVSAEINITSSSGSAQFTGSASYEDGMYFAEIEVSNTLKIGSAAMVEIIVDKAGV